MSALDAGVTLTVERLDGDTPDAKLMGLEAAKLSFAIESETLVRSLVGIAVELHDPARIAALHIAVASVESTLDQGADHIRIRISQDPPILFSMIGAPLQLPDGRPSAVAAHSLLP